MPVYLNNMFIGNMNLVFYKSCCCTVRSYSLIELFFNFPSSKYFVILYS